MKYQELFLEENNQVMERYDLVMERIAEIPTEDRVAEPYKAYFTMAARFIGQIELMARAQMREEYVDANLTTLAQMNQDLYADVRPDHYDLSYANPVYAREQLGAELGGLLCFLYKELRGSILFAYECRLTEITILCETFVEVYNAFEEELPKTEIIKNILYWFISDYSDMTVVSRIRECLDPELSFAKDIIMEQDLNDLRYLYRFGEYISDSELQTAAFLNQLPEETIQKMADTYTEGYRKGFEVMGRDLSCKKTVSIRYELGFERMIRAAVLNFRSMGLEPIIYRSAVWTVNQNAGRKVGYHGTSVNQQFDYDHRYDTAFFLNKAFKDRKLAVLRVAYEQYKELAKQYAGPAVVETFGQDGFTPVLHDAAPKLSEKQEELQIAYSNEAMSIVNQYIPGDETSFTIIAFPVPAIGKNFKEIFLETIRINTLDYEVYKTIQQRIIDVLDEADYVTITGSGCNETAMKVKLHELTDPKKMTNFENCVADVNIPLGEVFTSPLLTGTEGLLHVSSVYLGDMQYKNLKLWFQDGMITKYSCENFEDMDQGKNLIRQQILKNHDTLPIGEFAIGTNTTAYAMAQKYDVIEKLPILIVEKMGPHFAVGDTCYSWSEDSAVYNPDGKEIIARDNEVSLLRKEDVSKAYFGCHTDITIPYRELGDITAVKKDGTEIPVMRNGRFAVEGTAQLNHQLE